MEVNSDLIFKKGHFPVKQFWTNISFSHLSFHQFQWNLLSKKHYNSSEYIPNLIDILYKLVEGLKEVFDQNYVAEKCLFSKIKTHLLILMTKLYHMNCYLTDKWLWIFWYPLIRPVNILHLCNLPFLDKRWYWLKLLMKSWWKHTCKTTNRLKLL